MFEVVRLGPLSSEAVLLSSSGPLRPRGGSIVENWGAITVISEGGAVAGIIRHLSRLGLGRRSRRRRHLGLGGVFGEPVVQGFEAHPEHLGRAPLVAAAVLERGKDGLAL